MIKPFASPHSFDHNMDNDDIPIIVYNQNSYYLLCQISILSLIYIGTNILISYAPNSGGKVEMVEMPMKTAEIRAFCGLPQ